MLLIKLVNLTFFVLEGLILGHVILSYLYAMRNRPRWIYHPISMWIDDTGRRILRPFRLILDRVGLSQLTRPIDFSPMLAWLVLGWIQNTLIVWLVRLVIFR
jgi:uncharacterized protein YggT (Ycf19 family)